MRRIGLAMLVCLVPLVSVHETVQAQPTPRRFPWVYVVQNPDHHELESEVIPPDPVPENGVTDFARAELSVSVLNGTGNLSRLRIHSFTGIGSNVVSQQDQVQPGESRQEFYWKRDADSVAPAMNTRTVIISSERPLHVDAVANYTRYFNNFDKHELNFTEYSKRTLPVQEINCATQATLYGWFCGVVAAYPVNTGN